MLSSCSRRSLCSLCKIGQGLGVRLLDRGTGSQLDRLEGAEAVHPEVCEVPSGEESSLKRRSSSANSMLFDGEGEIQNCSLFRHEDAQAHVLEPKSCSR